jgi:glutamine cyclotransferase
MALGEEYFGEGIVQFEGKIYQLTWKNKQGFIYDLNSFKRLGSFDYQTEGWGLTQDGKSLIMSDGSEQIHFLNPKTLKLERSLTVTLEGKAINNLNELEYVGGKIYANVWQTTQIVIIDPKSGVVEGLIDLRGLALLMPPGTDVLNGIAYDSGNKRLFVTGKYWPFVFELELIRK